MALPALGAALRGTAGQQVMLTVRRAAEAELEHVAVVALSGRQDSDLRYSDWEASRRAMVEELGGGRVGYLHVRNMAAGSYEEFARQVRGRLPNPRAPALAAPRC